MEAVSDRDGTATQRSQRMVDRPAAVLTATRVVAFTPMGLVSVTNIHVVGTLGASIHFPSHRLWIKLASMEKDSLTRKGNDTLRRGPQPLGERYRAWRPLEHHECGFSDHPTR
jgi:hypothetical protein